MYYLASVQLKHLDDTDMVDEESRPMTLGYILWKSALYVDKGSNPPAEEKVMAYNLARRLHDTASSVSLSIEELALLKRNVGAMWSPLIVGQVWALLDKPLPEEREEPVPTQRYIDKPTASGKSPKSPSWS